MCCKNGGSCYQCDPGFRSYFEQEVEKAKRAEVDYQDLLEPKFIWRDYCRLRDAEKAEDEIDNLIEKDYSSEDLKEAIGNPNEW